MPIFKKSILKLSLIGTTSSLLTLHAFLDDRDHVVLLSDSLAELGSKGSLILRTLYISTLDGTSWHTSNGVWSNPEETGDSGPRSLVSNLIKINPPNFHA